ncbi:MAG TPA: prepilin-type N-terminal cleavage/methylation domain-containing protein [Lacunisphaera sp.]|nr:prepilin-type N-terminal cleavage/methylation domain-containing protein [Lacunisphaera sp.]
MTISTPRTNPRAHVTPPPLGQGGLVTPKLALRASAGGFTLVEVMIAATLSTFVLAGVLSAFVFLGRTSFRSSGYSEMEAEVRRALEQFASDTRSATDVRWGSDQSLTLTVNGSAVTYAYDGTAGSATYQAFYRVVGDVASAPRTILVRGVGPDFAFRRYKLTQPGVADNTAQNDSETKLLQVSLRASRTTVAAAGASQPAISARYLLRNKRVAN